MRAPFACSGGFTSFGWFRIFGYGLSWKNTSRHAMLFSERTGLTRPWKLGRWRIGLLLPVLWLCACAGQVVGTATTCPDHAIPTTTCDVPLPTYCVFSPNIHLTVDGSCVVDVLTGCQYNGNFVHFELPYDGGAVSSPGQFYGSTCTFTVEPR